MDNIDANHTTAPTPDIDWDKFLASLESTYKDLRFVPKICGRTDYIKEFPNNPRRIHRAMLDYISVCMDIRRGTFVVVESFWIENYNTTVVYIRDNWAVAYVPGFDEEDSNSVLRWTMSFSNVKGVDMIHQLLGWKVRKVERWWRGKILVGGGDGVLGKGSEEGYRKWLSSISEFAASGGDVVEWARKKGYMETRL